jgi:hypothetical protein
MDAPTITIIIGGYSAWVWAAAGIGAGEDQE